MADWKKDKDKEEDVIEEEVVVEAVEPESEVDTTITETPTVIIDGVDSRTA